MIAEGTPECKLEEVQELTASLEGYVHQAAREGLPIHQVEKEVWERVLQIGRQAVGRASRVIERLNDIDGVLRVREAKVINLSEE